ncbi:MAG: rod shape-determining protein MreC [Candidatus Moranbacteria bacterium]|nr:rod shape-determining protein MreC [Candidatus Moranbacteria bacterium]
MREGIVPKSKLIRTLVVLGILFGIAIADPAPFSGTLRGIFHTVFWPFEKAFSTMAVSARDASMFLSSIGELNRENERLSEENLRLIAENAGLVFLRGENEALRKDVGLEIRKKYDLMATEVIVSGGEAQRGSVIVDRGSVHGVKAGMSAIIGDGLFVGVVDEVYPVSASVALVTNSKVAIGGVTAENGSKGIVRGDRGLGIFYGMVLQSDVLREGDRVMTSGTTAMPSGLYIGSIGTVRDSTDRLFREANVVSPVDFDSLRFLFLIRDGG